MSQTEIKHLLEKYRIGQCTEEERALLDSWYLQQLDRPANISPEEIRDAEAQIRSDVFSHIRSAQQRNSRKLWMTGIAASLLLIAGLGIGISIFNKAQKDSKRAAIAYLNDVKPGGNKAVLTLGNGKKIILADAQNGVLVNQQGIKITKTADGQLIYEAVKSAAAKSPDDYRYNTVETPLGGQYQIILPDLTKVWLNAGSSLEYPSNFDLFNKRIVKLSGEAYFEVAHNKNKPFIVLSANQSVRVLGTHFNVNTYSDAPKAVTTLLEGSVVVTNLSAKNRDRIIIEPGQESVVAQDGILVRAADTEAAVAWKNGYFIFRNEELHSIMRKVSRWYDIDIVFEKGVNQSRTFEGSISRFKQVSELLRKFELTGNIHFKIEGRRIIVMQ